jgi:hypothetical protein
MKYNIDELSNSEIEWEGTYIGLTPILTGAKAQQVAEMGKQVIPQLLAVLADEGKFVAAHVLLTRLSGVEYQAFPSWNGLAVDMAADGTVTIYPEQRFDLARRWEQWYHTEPRPNVLPSSEG